MGVHVGAGSSGARVLGAKPGPKPGTLTVSYPRSHPSPLETTPGEAARTTSGTAEVRNSHERAFP